MKRRLEVDPLHGPILKNMLLFGLPIVGSSILHVLFSAADTAVIGNFGHEGAISAIGVCMPVCHLLIAGLGALSGGVTIVFGRMYGRRETDKVSDLVQALPLTAFTLGAALAIVACVLSTPILRLVNCPESLFAEARVYFCIYFAAVPFSMTQYFLASVLQSRGNSFIPFVFQMSAAVVNIFINLIFVIVFDWNIAGVASATLFSQMLSSTAMVVFYTRQRDEIRLHLNRMRVFTGLGEVFRVGIPSSLEGMIINISGVVISAAINRFDPVVIAGNTLSGTLEGFMSISFVAFSSSGVVFISQNYGHRDLPRVRRIFRTTLAGVLIAGEVIGFLVYLASPYVLKIFSPDAGIIAYARVRLFYMCMFYGLCGTLNAISGCVRGLGNTKLPLAISVISSFFFRITWIYTYAAWKGTIEAIYMAYPICWAINTVLNVAAFYYVFKQRAAELEADVPEEVPLEN